MTIFGHAISLSSIDIIYLISYYISLSQPPHQVAVWMPACSTVERLSAYRVWPVHTRVNGGGFTGPHQVSQACHRAPGPNQNQRGPKKGSISAWTERGNANERDSRTRRGNESEKGNANGSGNEKRSIENGNGRKTKKETGWYFKDHLSVWGEMYITLL